MLKNLDFYATFGLFVRLLIGMGLKIALVPFLDLTRDIDVAMQQRISGKMVQTAVRTAIFLVLFSWLLMWLLLFTVGAASVAGGIALLLLALNRLLSPARKDHHAKVPGHDPMAIAVYPLTLPY